MRTLRSVMTTNRTRTYACVTQILRNDQPGHGGNFIFTFVFQSQIYKHYNSVFRIVIYIHSAWMLLHKHEFNLSEEECSLTFSYIFVAVSLLNTCHRINGTISLQLICIPFPSLWQNLFLLTNKMLVVLSYIVKSGFLLIRSLYVTVIRSVQCYLYFYFFSFCNVFY